MGNLDILVVVLKGLGAFLFKFRIKSYLPILLTTKAGSKVQGLVKIAKLQIVWGNMQLLHGRL